MINIKISTVPEIYCIYNCLYFNCTFTKRLKYFKYNTIATSIVRKYHFNQIVILGHSEHTQKEKVPADNASAYEM